MSDGAASGDIYTGGPSLLPDGWNEPKKANKGRGPDCIPGELRSEVLAFVGGATATQSHVEVRPGRVLCVRRVAHPDPAAPTIVLVHSALGSTAEFAALMPALSRHFNLVAYDQYGRGESSAGLGGGALERRTEEPEEQQKQFGPDEALQDLREVFQRYSGYSTNKRVESANAVERDQASRVGGRDVERDRICRVHDR